MITRVVAAVVVAVVLAYLKVTVGKRKKERRGYCESVNYHFTRQCNYSCKFCFHTAKTSFVLDESTAKAGLDLLK